MSTIKFTAQIPQVSLKQKEKNKKGKKQFYLYICHASHIATDHKDLMWERAS